MSDPLSQTTDMPEMDGEDESHAANHQSLTKSQTSPGALNEQPAYLTDLLEEDESESVILSEVTRHDIQNKLSTRRLPSQHSVSKFSRSAPPSKSNAPKESSHHESDLISPSHSVDSFKESDDEDEKIKVVLGLEGESDDDLSALGHDDVDIENGEGYDTDLEIDDYEWLNPTEEYDSTGINSYVQECNRLGIIPVSYFVRHVHDKQFVMRNHGLGPLGAKALTVPLENNTEIEVLDLEGNAIGAEGTQYLCDMLKDNIYITDLNLTENCLGASGCEALCIMMAENVRIEAIKLSGNNFSDSSCQHFQTMLEKNSTLRRLSLRHNNFEEEGLKYFRDALAVNENLKFLDLSWNHIRQKGALYVAEIVRDNYGLKYLNLSMNGLSDAGAAALGAALKVNQCLVELNIMENRITQTGAEELSKGLVVNDCLNTLQIGMNSILHEGALALLTAIDKNENSALALLDLTNVIVTQEFEDIKDKMNETRNNTLTVIHGGIYFGAKQSETFVEVDPEAEFENDPMTKLKNYANKAKLRLIDLFKMFDKDNSWTVDREEFIKGIKSTGIDMSEHEIDILIQRLDKDGDGEIDYSELRTGDNEHKELEREVKMKKDAKL